LREFEKYFPVEGKCVLEVDLQIREQAVAFRIERATIGFANESTDREQARAHRQRRVQEGLQAQ
jgi:hypothetical protein